MQENIWVELSSFLFSLLLILLSPLVGAHLERVEKRYYDSALPHEVLTKLGTEGDPGTHPGAVVEPKNIAQYSQYIVECFQMATVALAPTLGLIITRAGMGQPFMALEVLAYIFTITASGGMYVKMSFAENPDPATYFSKGWFGKYGLASKVGIVVNLVAIIFVTCIHYDWIG